MACQCRPPIRWCVLRLCQRRWPWTKTSSNCTESQKKTAVTKNFGWKSSLKSCGCFTDLARTFLVFLPIDSNFCDAVDGPEIRRSPPGMVLKPCKIMVDKYGWINCFTFTSTGEWHPDTWTCHQCRMFLIQPVSRCRRDLNASSVQV